MGYKYEMHLHTSEGSKCGGSTGAEMVKAFYEIGFAGLVVTDHFFNGNSTVPRDLPWAERVELYCKGYENALQEAKKYEDFDVFFGIEFGYPPYGKEFLTYGVDKQFLLSNPDIMEIPIEEYAARVKAYGGYIAQAHPYRQADYIDDSKLPDPSFLDGVETFNFGNTWRDPVWNDMAEEFANKYDLGKISGSDTHHIGVKGSAGMEFDYRIKTPKELVAALHRRDGRLIINGEVQK
ncbi:MAG: PHP domain-containing protein [Clostridia bacterium]|nr:PHP domain-containing protein [Clostridia bacterium]